MVERTKVVANFAKLIDDVISLQFVCIHLSKSIKELGEIYVKNPRHFHKIFGAVTKLCLLIQTDLQTCNDDFIALQEKNKDEMQIARKEQFPNEVRNLLDSVAVGVERLGAEIKNCRRKAKKAITKDTIQSVSYEMLEVVESVLGRYFKDTNTINTEPEKQRDSLLDDDETSATSSDASKHAGAASQRQIQSISPPKTEEELLAQLKSLMQEIYNRTLIISQSESQNSKNYFNLYDALMVMQEKSISLVGEPDKTAERLFKAEKTLELTLNLATRTSQFLNKTLAERKQLASSFAREVHNTLNSEENSDVIDCHSNSISRFFYTHLCHFSLFSTDTRKKLTEFDSACMHLM